MNSMDTVTGLSSLTTALLTSTLAGCGGELEAPPPGSSALRAQVGPAAEADDVCTGAAATPPQVDGRVRRVGAP